MSLLRHRTEPDEGDLDLQRGVGIEAIEAIAQSSLSFNQSG
jgi:hypothetical protein